MSRQQVAAFKMRRQGVNGGLEQDERASLLFFTTGLLVGPGAPSPAAALSFFDAPA